MPQMTDQPNSDWRHIPVTIPDKPAARQPSYAKMRCRWSTGQTRQADLQRAQADIEQHMQQADIDTTPAFDLQGDWPDHPLMDSVRQRVRERVTQRIAERNLLVDEKDALFQVLFRLTALPPRRLFQDGDAARQLLDGVSTDQWRGILDLDRDDFHALALDEAVIDRVIDEQLAVIQDRLAASPLPLERILEKTGICSGDWVLKRTGGEVVAEDRRTGDQRGIELREVDQQTATQFHQDLHYIHTPRTGTAYGLYAEGAELPFSVESVEPVDRDYKQAALLLHGHDPDNCVELTRLYNWPSPPMNTVSIMDRLVFDRFRDEGIEAVSTTIMPTYTLSKSQTAGGIDQAYLAKRPEHTFIGRDVGGRTALEHATKRKRQRRGQQPVRRDHPDFPLLPVVELINGLSAPSIEPSHRVDGSMITMGYGG
ncbi:MAG: hypothetical protein SV186_01900 [Candidatus Nanohaloarchaea archaeon]|nr:hypothetical protein [Candidatus Nanohaloarchaea archaeon]